jgi:putative SOS response-associated peptidase YedK
MPADTRVAVATLFDALQWGLIPYWARDPKIAYKTINARVERMEEGRRRKIPCSIGMKDDAPFVFAGLWEGWKDPTTEKWLHTCTIITGEPNELVAKIHTRMPVILAE